MGNPFKRVLYKLSSKTVWLAIINSLGSTKKLSYTHLSIIASANHPNKDLYTPFYPEGTLEVGATGLHQ